MKKIITYLEILGLSPQEITLYLKLLQTGPISVGKLTRLTRTNRTSAYVYIKQLLEKGLITETIRGIHKEFAAQNPEESIKQLIEKKRQSIKIVEEEFPEIIQTLQKSLPQEQPVDETEIRYFKGIHWARKIYTQALEAKELRTYVRLLETGSFFSDSVTLINTYLKKNPQLIMKEIVYNSPFTHEQASHLLPRHKNYAYKIAPKNLKLTSEDILIYDEKVAIINYTGEIISVVGHSRDYSNNSKELFDFIWKMI